MALQLIVGPFSPILNLALEAPHLSFFRSQRSKQPLESKSKPLNVVLIEHDEGNEYVPEKGASVFPV